MPAVCLFYEVHEPYRLRRYTIFDMGQNSLYEDDDRNCDALLYAASNCYLPMNSLLLKLCQRYGKDFRVTFSISGTALDQFEQYAPEVLESFQALADTGCVEFACETAPHSLALLYSLDEFVIQVKNHLSRLKRLFGHRATTFRNSELVYDNDLPPAIRDLGFRSVLAEGADHVLGWRSPNYVYRPVTAPGMRLFMRNAQLSGDLAARFNDQGWDQWPLTSEKYASWLHALEGSADVVNIFNDYHIFGLRNPAVSGIFAFMEALPGAVLANKSFHFSTIGEAAKKIEASGDIDVPQFMSWDDEGHDLTAWLGNDMQKDAIHSLYSLADRVRALDNATLAHDFERLQTADHFHYMSTKWFSDFLPDRPNPFASPYDAYITYMNVLADFEMRLGAAEDGWRARARHPSRSTRTAAADETGAVHEQAVAKERKGRKSPARKTNA